jgi:transposase
MAQLNDKQLDILVERVPDAARSPKGGRPPADKKQVLRAIFWIVDNGAKWQSLPPAFGSKSTAHRWFKRWSEAGVFQRLMETVARELEAQGDIELEECFLDASFSKAKGGGDRIGKNAAGKGCKIMLMVDAHGLPIAACAASAQPHESTLVQQLFDFVVTVGQPQRVVADRAYDADPLDAELARQGVKLIAPHKRNRVKPRTQDGRELRRYRRRWIVERSFSWLHNFRRLCIRWERYAHLYQAVLHLVCAVLLTKAVLG